MSGAPFPSSGQSNARGQGVSYPEQDRLPFHSTDMNKRKAGFFQKSDVFFTVRWAPLEKPYSLKERAIGFVYLCMADSRMAAKPDDLIPTRESLLSRIKDWDDRESWQDFFDTYW